MPLLTFDGARCRDSHDRLVGDRGSRGPVDRGSTDPVSGDSTGGVAAVSAVAVRLLAIVALAAAVLMVTVAAAQAAPADAEQDSGVAEALRSGPGLLTDLDTSTVGPGVHLVSFQRLERAGWLRGHVLEVDLERGGTELDVVGGVSGTAPLSEMINEEGAFAGINGDFTDGVGRNPCCGPTGSTGGPVMSGSRLLKAAVPYGQRIGPRHPPMGSIDDVFGVGADRLGRIAQVALEGTVTTPDGELPLAGLNQYALPEGGIGAFTPLWGDASRLRPLCGNDRGQAAPCAERQREVVVRQGVVAEVSDAPGTDPIPEDGFVLLAREEGADALAGLEPGDRVSIDYAPRTDAGAPFTAAAGGFSILRDGEAGQGTDVVPAPRSGAGVSADGRTLFLVAVEGRSGESRGLNLPDFAEFMRAIGADDAINLDGGGSTTMVARAPGAADAALVNDPSDGAERGIGTGIGLFAAPGSGELRGFRITAGVDTPHPERVFPGLTRSFDALAHDETSAPVEGSPAVWGARPGNLGRVDRDGVLTARESGTGSIVVRRMRATATHELQVLGDLARVGADVEGVSLADAGDTGRFSVVGYDADGFDALIEPRDVQLDYDESVVRIEPTDDGGFVVTPLVGSGATAVAIGVGDVEAFLPVTVGLSTVGVEDYDDGLDGWGAARFPAAVAATIEPAPGRDGGGALALDYDFSTTTATRAAYVQADPRVELPGQPQRLGMWVNGDGNGAWLRVVVTDAAGVNSTLSLTGQEPGVDFTGWRYLETAVPAGVQYPLRLWRVYPVETNPADQYAGRLLIDDIVAGVPQSLDVPATPEVADPTVITDGRLGDDRWSFAVMSDTQFVAASGPDSVLADQARRTLREIVAADPDFVVINGDLVDTAYPEDFDLARDILDEEVPDDLPLYYSPGNHELTGPGTIDNFVAEFGETRRTFDHRGTRFVLLDSSTGSFRSADYDQLLDLRETLDDAVTNPSVDHVVVMAHHPPRDPSPAANSQLSDRKEAALVEQWLTDFETDSGKDAAYVGSHAGVFHAERVDGVPYVLTGNSGKGPSAAADDGGFTGWALFGVVAEDAPPRPRPPAAGGEWLAAELRPHVDRLTLDAPDALAVGETAAADATVTQDGREVPVAYPVSADWEGGPDLHIGPADEARGHHAAAFDPATGELVGLREGRVVLSVTVNGQTATTTIDVDVDDAEAA